MLSHWKPQRIPVAWGWKESMSERAVGHEVASLAFWLGAY